MSSFQKKLEEHLCNLCGVDSLMFELPPKCCCNCDTLIKPNAKYYQKPSSLLQYLCNRCYASILTKAEQVEMKKLKHNEACEEPVWDFYFIFFMHDIPFCSVLTHFFSWIFSGCNVVNAKHGNTIYVVFSMRKRM